MKTINWLMFSLVVVFVLPGCSIVTSLNPVGTNPIQIQRDDWEGVWCSCGKDKLVYFVWVKDKDKGILRIGVVQEDEKEDFTLVKFDVQLRQGKSSVFGNILFNEMVKEEAMKEMFKEKEMKELIGKSYLWFMIKNVGGSIVIHVPNDNNFEKLVKEGKLKWKKVPSYGPDHIVICEPTEKITEFIDSYDDSGNLFEWKSPRTFRRVIEGVQK